MEVAPTATPPVCRIMDNGKFRYLEKKKAHESRRKQTVILVKEVKVGSRTDVHDVDFKVNHIRRFLEKENQTSRAAQKKAKSANQSRDRQGARIRCHTCPCRIWFDARRNPGEYSEFNPSFGL